eukprot:CAMPEP_0179104934 /NCGR_PEP_ID=MMETSP0796-20121207/48709_1 /TAXON_ID=73915 /ORGANISM="Pyrodinium bahamense, Strain pbaha01" /LENGTH=270 /DNA_ID=CAMNT_0020802907 /DNA_START=38 /DNA_END=846 /DNA_ORIENTATION=+
MEFSPPFQSLQQRGPQETPSGVEPRRLATGPKVQLQSPSVARLAVKCQERLCDGRRLQDPVLRQLLQEPRHHPADGVGRVHHPVNADVADVHASRPQLVAQALAERPAAGHGGGVGVLPAVAAHSSGGGCEEHGAAAPCEHEGRELLGRGKGTQAAHAPGHFEDAVACPFEAAAADLRAYVVHRHLDWPYVSLDSADHRLDVLGLGAVGEEGRGAHAVLGPQPLAKGFEAMPPLLAHQAAGPTAPAHAADVEALAGKAPRHRLPDAGTGP